MAIATDRDRQIETTLELMRIILDRLNRADTEMIEKGSTDELISELEWGARVLEVEDVVRCYMAGGLNPRQEQELLDLLGYAMRSMGAIRRFKLASFKLPPPDGPERAVFLNERPQRRGHKRIAG